MSVAGQSRQFGRRPTTSGLPLETDIAKDGRHVSKVPRADIADALLNHFVCDAQRGRYRYPPRLRGLAEISACICSK
jgi:hypothetical protein